MTLLTGSCFLFIIVSWSLYITSPEYDYLCTAFDKMLVSLLNTRVLLYWFYSRSLYLCRLDFIKTQYIIYNMQVIRPSQFNTSTLRVVVVAFTIAIAVVIIGGTYLLAVPFHWTRWDIGRLVAVAFDCAVIGV